MLKQIIMGIDADRFADAIRRMSKQAFVDTVNKFTMDDWLRLPCKAIAAVIDKSNTLNYPKNPSSPITNEETVSVLLSRFKTDFYPKKCGRNPEPRFQSPDAYKKWLKDEGII